MQLYSLAMWILTAYFVIGMVVYLVVAFGLNKWDSTPEDNLGEPLDDSIWKQMEDFIDSLTNSKEFELEVEQKMTMYNIFKCIHRKKAGNQKRKAIRKSILIQV